MMKYAGLTITFILAYLFSRIVVSNIIGILFYANTSGEELLMKIHKYVRPTDTID